ncbi:Oxidoreductase family, NAD-binding Rossmann fold [compost metagenome]
MAKTSFNRRDFIKSAALAGAGIGLNLSPIASIAKDISSGKGKRIGIIGLDTTHSIAFTKALNDPNAGPEYAGYRVVAAYPYGSRDIELCIKRIPVETEEIKKYGVKITGSIAQLLKEVDVVLLETNDGRLHLEQALEVLKAGKPLFIDKPMAASFKDGAAIFKAAEEYKVPVFSSSSLRFMSAIKDVNTGKYGKVTGADTYSPAYLEKTHTDLFWYGIHGVETLFSVMGPGCKQVTQFSAGDTDVVVGTWADNRIGTYRGLRSGKTDFGGTCYCEKEIVQLGPYVGYAPLLIEIIQFFESGKPPVSSRETLEILAFMEAAAESKLRGGKPVAMPDFSQL